MRFRVFVFLLIASAVSVFSQEAEEQPAEPVRQAVDEWYLGKPIREIVFSGLKNISQNELDGLMNPYKGRVFNDSIFLEIQGKLYALEYFERIEPTTHRYNTAGSEVIIRFAVIERPIVGRINFVGNSGLRRAELMELITSKTGDIYNFAKSRTDVEAISAKYIEKGYPDATVRVSETHSGDSTVTLSFHIVENERMSISKIEFQGNTRFSNNVLKGKLSLKAKSLINDGAFQEAKLLADREAITKHYHDRGYIEAAVRDVTRTYTKDDKGTTMVLTFMIDEGGEYTFGGVTFEGNIIFTSEQLDKLVSSKIGDIANMTKVEMDLQRVADLYFENGYIFNSIMRDKNVNHQTNVLSYHISIVERSRAYIENIIVLGNEKTKSHVILREIPMEPGDIFSRTKVMDAMRNLYNLQYFSAILPDTLPGSSENLMDLIISVEEQPTTDVQFGVTFSGVNPDTFPISGLVKWTDRNLVGSGNELGAEINSTVIDSSSLSVNYVHRWALGLPLSLGTDLSANYARYNAALDNQPPFFYGSENYAFPDGFISREEYESNALTPSREYMMQYRQWYISLGLSTGYRWATFLGSLSLNGGMRFGIIKNVYDAELYRPFDPALREGNNRWTFKNSLWIAVSIDQRDIFYDPSKGYYIYDRIGLYGIFGGEREHYFRNEAKAEYFITLFNIPITEKWSFKCILGAHIGFSAIFKQPGRDLFLEDKNKLAVDGMFTGRGWSSSYKDRGGYYNKGLVLIDSWVELRFPIVPGILALDLFFDAAGVEDEEGKYFGVNNKGNKNFTMQEMLFSFGGGFRFTMPQFPIRLSLAKRFFVNDNGSVEWVPGAIKFGKSPTGGLDIVMSFVLSY
ncbi:MAG: outer membrane protein assembly factor BamA [Treponema sp.]|nr:outer membrane protein assembly factor BamA [Treponema sp.]